VYSLQGDLKISHDCGTEAVEIASTNQVPNAMMEIYAASKKLAPSELDIPEKSDKANKPQPAEELAPSELDIPEKSDKARQVIAARPPPSGRVSTPNRKTHSSTSSRLTATSSRGSQRTCQGCPGS
jgi:hypothetical protein